MNSSPRLNVKTEIYTCGESATLFRDKVERGERKGFGFSGPSDLCKKTTLVNDSEMQVKLPFTYT